MSNSAAFAALGWGLLSALSLPLGALIAVLPSIPDPSEPTLGLMMSFGGGCLLFAVSVEMFAEGLRTVEHDKENGKLLMWITIACSLLGAVVYLYLNRWLSGGGARGVSMTAHWRRTGVRALLTHKHTNDILRPLLERLLFDHFGVQKEDLRKDNELREQVSELVATWDTDADGSLTIQEIDRIMLDASHMASLDARVRVLAMDVLHPHSVGGRVIDSSLSTAVGGKVTCVELVDSLMEIFDMPEEAEEYVMSMTTPRPGASSGKIQRENPMYAMDDDSDDDEDSVLSPQARYVAATTTASPRAFAAEADARGAAALSIWLGIAIDGVPEAMMIGFMASENQMSVAFIVSVFMANFPEAMSSSVVMRKQGDAPMRILLMWFSLCAGTGIIACITAFCSPSTSTGSFSRRVVSASAEGVAAGSMIACISTAMLPEGFEQGGDLAGIWTMVGFLVSLVAKMAFEDHNSTVPACVATVNLTAH